MDRVRVQVRELFIVIMLSALVLEDGSHDDGDCVNLLAFVDLLGELSVTSLFASGCGLVDAFHHEPCTSDPAALAVQNP